MRAAWPLAIALVASLSLSGCLGIDNMAELKAALGFQPLPLEILPPVARLRASLTLAAVGQPVAFSAQGSLDPQGLPLDFAWDLGDGTRARGSEATHRYATGGLFTVTLEATNAAGLTGQDTLVLTVLDNEPPSASLAVLREGQEVKRALAGEELTFRAEARDPEGQPLALAWDFGDGATALTPEARHRYEQGGRYLVTLRAEDPSGLAAEASQLLAVDELLSAQGQVAVGRDSFAHPVRVGSDAERVVARVAFDPMLGVNGLVVLLADAQGQEVTRAAGQPPPGTQGIFEVVLEAAREALGGHAPGSWSVVVQRASGLQVDYRLTGEVRY